jgi:hypothetical protein
VTAQKMYGDKTYAESEGGMRKGIIVKGIEADFSFHNIASASKEIYGTEIHSTWGEIEKVEGVYDWSYIDQVIAQYKAQGKTIGLNLVTANFSINDSPDYLYSKYNIRRIAAGYWENFEKADKGYVLHTPKTSTNPLSGSYSLRLASATKAKMIETGANHVLNRSTGITNPSFKPNNIVYPYASPGFCLQFDFRANSATTFYAKANSVSLGELNSFYQEWSANAGESGSKTFQFSPSANDYRVEIGIVSGDLSIDNVNICDMKTAYYVGTLCFPNYFDIKFNERYEIFIQALANKYKDEPGLSSVCIGGYGRWEEMTLCDDQEPNRFEDQWTTYGFTNQKYIEHVKWCIDTFKKYFQNKKLYTGAVGWSTDSFRDQTLIDWAVQGYAAKNGVGIKYNGWQTKCSEWGSEGVSIFYQMNRYKQDPGVLTFFEEGAQLNNSSQFLTQIMGHPVSLLNRAAIDGIDYQWMYQLDAEDSYTTRYFHYSNEMAGSALFTKLYNKFEGNVYTSPKSGKTSVLKNINNGLFQKDYDEGTKYTYTTWNGEKVIQTNTGNSRIELSIDDRQKYNGMYGAELVMDYLDSGTDEFKVFAYYDNGTSLELIKVKKTNSKQWKILNVKDNGWTSKVKSRGGDKLVEIAIDDMSDGIETLHLAEINYVPAREWQEIVIQGNQQVSGLSSSISGNFTFEITNDQNKPVSSMSVNVSPASQSYVNIIAEVYAKINGYYILANKKDFYMPQTEDWFDIPLAGKPFATAYRVILTMDIGSANINLGADNKPAYRLYSFVNEVGETVDAGTSGNYIIESLKPFWSLSLTDNSQVNLVLKKQQIDGSFRDASTVYGSGNQVYFEPQNAGRYMLVNSSGNSIPATPNYLKRISKPKFPIRNVRGSLFQEFKGDNAFKVISGLKNGTNDGNGFHASVSELNPVLETSKPFKYETIKNQDRLHFVMKNETGAMFAKIYWKTTKADYSEENAMLMPVVPNDNEYREYSYAFARETGYRDSIIGFRFVPVYGFTNVGKIHIYKIEIRKGNTFSSTYADSLQLETTDFNVFTQLGIKSFKLNEGSDFTEQSVVSISNEIVGGNPTEYIISENEDFADAIWMPYSSAFDFTLSPDAGIKRIYFKVRDGINETPAVSALIVFKLPNVKLDASTRMHVNFYPNPSQLNVRFDCTDNLSEPFNVTILSVTGIIYEQRKEFGNFNLNISKYPKGALLVRIENNKGIIQSVIIKE